MFIIQSLNFLLKLQSQLFLCAVSFITQFFNDGFNLLIPFTNHLFLHFTVVFLLRVLLLLKHDQFQFILFYREFLFYQADFLTVLLCEVLNLSLGFPCR